LSRSVIIHLPRFLRQAGLGEPQQVKIQLNNQGDIPEECCLTLVFDEKGRILSDRVHLSIQGIGLCAIPSNEIRHLEFINEEATNLK